MWGVVEGFKGFCAFRVGISVAENKVLIVSIHSNFFKMIAHPLLYSVGIIICKDLEIIPKKLVWAGYVFKQGEL